MTAMPLLALYIQKLLDASRRLRRRRYRRMRRAARAAALLLALLAAPTRPDGGAEEPRLELTLQNGRTLATIWYQSA